MSAEHDSGSLGQPQRRAAVEPNGYGKVGRASVPAGDQSSHEEMGRAPRPASPPPSIVYPDLRGAVFEGYSRRLPHWRMDQATYFVTWRLFPSQMDLSPQERSLVADALKHFDGRRYHLLAYVVMNDHVHVLVQPFEGQELERITHSWKSFTANRARQKFGRLRSLWQDESFDRIVRNDDEFLEKLYYILNNPLKRWPEIAHYPWTAVHVELEDLVRDQRSGHGGPPH